MFPLEHLGVIVRLTNVSLCHTKKTKTTEGEILKFFGILILVTRFEFGKKRDLWKKRSRNPYIPAPNFGEKTGVSLDRFFTLLSNIKFSKQPQEQGNMRSMHFRWALVQDFVDAFNKHRLQAVTPSEMMCVDESISRWYGIGGGWMDIGLPHYVALDSKPEHGCEVQNTACGRSGIMLHLQLVSTADDERDRAYEGQMLHGTAVLRRLVEPWAGTQRIVCADSYFASVEAADEMRKIGLKFIGVVKTASTKFPIRYLSGLEIDGRGKWNTLVRKDDTGNQDMMAVVWVDRNRRYFVANTSSTLDGKLYTRTRWKQFHDGAPKVDMEVRQPEVAENYYGACVAFDQRNRCRQDDLMLERKLQTHDWSFRINCSILGIIVVDSWLLYAGECGWRAKLSRREFYEDLATALIENRYDMSRPSVPLGQSVQGDCTPVRRSSGIGIHLTPTKKRRKKNGSKRLSHCRTIAKSTSERQPTNVQRVLKGAGTTCGWVTL